MFEGFWPATCVWILCRDVRVPEPFIHLSVGNIMCSNVTAKHVRHSGIRPHFLVIFLCVLSICLPTVSTLNITEIFYPFGNCTTDSQTDQKDDGGSGPVELNVAFPFFNRSFKQIFVNNNGIISFNAKFEQSYQPVLFDRLPDPPPPLVAPFWADVDIQNVKGLGEAVYYRESNDTSLLERASVEIRSYFFNQQYFQATNLFIVTWYKVGFYGAQGEEGKRKRNTFQCVLVTDGHFSFAFFNYYNLVWTSGANSQGGQGNATTGLGGNAAVVGFYSPVDKYHIVNGSGTIDILNLAKTSNVGIPGKYVFQLDGDAIGSLKCNIGNDLMSINPRFGSMLGGFEILAHGPCFIKGVNETNNVIARLLEIDVVFNCSIVTENTVSCVMPTVFKTGQFTFQLNKFGQGWNYSTTFSSVHLSQSPPKILRKSPKFWSIGTMVTISWSENDISTNGSRIAQVMAYSTKFNNTPALEPVQNLSVQSGVTLKFKLDSSLYVNYSTLIVKLCSERPNASQLCIWSDVFPVLWSKVNESKEWCNRWITREKHFPNITHNTPSCPCVLNQAEQDIGRFETDPFCDKTKDENSSNCLYFQGAEQCMQKNLQSPSGGGESCCYDIKGELLDIRAGSVGGFQQRYHYRAQGGETNDIVPFFSYFEEDFLPYLHCCQYSGEIDLCSKFLDFRPPSTCQGYHPPTPAQAAGDPHLVTLDGQNYTFNGVGEFTLVMDENKTVMVQVRAEQAKDKEGKPQNATVFSSIALCTINTSDIIEIRMTSNGGAEILVNRILFVPEGSSSHLNGIYLNQSEDNTTIYNVTLESVGLTVSVEVTQDLLNIIVLVGEGSLKGKLRGLLGNFNGNLSDDFQLSNGTVIESNSSMSDIHYKFGESWRVLANESILTPNGIQTVTSYQPIFMDQLGEMKINDSIVDMCGSNKLCIFDYFVTQKESVAQSTKSFSSKFDALKKQLNEKVVRCPFLPIPVNGNRSVDSQGVGALASYSCNSGTEMVGGSAQRTCQENGSWDGQEIVCATKINTSSTGNDYMTYIYITVSTVTVFVILSLVIIRICCKRCKSKPTVDTGIAIHDIFPPSPENIPIFQNQAFIESLQKLSEGGVFRIPRPNYVDPQIFQEYF